MEVIGKNGDDTFGLVVSKDELRVLSMVLGNISGSRVSGSVCALGHDMYFSIEHSCSGDSKEDSDKFLTGAMRYLEGSFEDGTVHPPRPPKGALMGGRAVKWVELADEAVPL